MLDKILLINNKDLLQLLQTKRQELIYSVLLEMTRGDLLPIQQNDQKQIDKLNDIKKTKEILVRFAEQFNLDLKAFNYLTQKKSFFTLLNIELSHAEVLREDPWLSFKTLLFNSVMFLISYYLFSRTVENINYSAEYKEKINDNDYAEWIAKKKDLIWNCYFHNSYENNPYLEPFAISKLTKFNKGFYEYWINYFSNDEDFYQTLPKLKETINDIAPLEYSELKKFIVPEKPIDEIHKEAIKESIIQHNQEKYGHEKNFLEKQDTRKLEDIQDIYHHNQSKDIHSENSIFLEFNDHDEPDKQPVENENINNNDFKKVSESTNNIIKEGAEKYEVPSVKINENVIINKIKADLQLQGYCVLEKQYYIINRNELINKINENIQAKDHLEINDLQINQKDYLYITYKPSFIINEIESLILTENYVKIVVIKDNNVTLFAYLKNSQAQKNGVISNEVLTTLNRIIDMSLNNDCTLEIVFYDNDLLLDLTNDLENREIQFSLIDNQEALSLLIKKRKENEDTLELQKTYVITYDNESNAYTILEMNDNSILVAKKSISELVNELLALIKNETDVIKISINLEDSKLNEILSTIDKNLSNYPGIFFSKLQDKQSTTLFVYNIEKVVEEIKKDITNQIKSKIDTQIIDFVNVYQYYSNAKNREEVYYRDLINIYQIVKNHMDIKINKINLSMDNLNEIKDKENKLQGYYQQENVIQPEEHDVLTKEKQDNIIKTDITVQESSHQIVDNDYIDTLEESIQQQTTSENKNIGLNQIQPNTIKSHEEDKPVADKKEFYNIKDISMKNVKSDTNEQITKKEELNDDKLNEIFDKMIDLSISDNKNDTFVDLNEKEENKPQLYDSTKFSTTVDLINFQKPLTSSNEEKSSNVTDNIIDKLIEEITREAEIKTNQNKLEEKEDSKIPNDLKTIADTTNILLSKSQPISQTNLISSELSKEERQDVPKESKIESLLKSELEKIDKFETKSNELIDTKERLDKEINEQLKHDTLDLTNKQENQTQSKQEKEPQKQETEKKNTELKEQFIVTKVDKKFRPKIIGQLNYLFSDNDCIIDIRKSVDGKTLKITMSIKDLALNNDYQKDELEHLFKIVVDNVQYYWNLSDKKMSIPELNIDINPKSFMIAMPGSRYVSEYSIDNIAEDAVYMFSALMMLVTDILYSSDQEIQELIESSNSSIKLNELKSSLEPLLKKVFTNIFDI
ncbi:MAG: hypothetical protein N3E37_02225 [Candidatus Micrarchaeota archaeon]|nr:hypothetical protein [Candidatus Micrarchaeota archaeon]